MLATVELAVERFGEQQLLGTSFARPAHGKTESFVNQYLAVLSASITTFAATNIDDAFLLTFFFARRIPARRIVAGQYLGFAAIVGLSLIVRLGRSRHAASVDSFTRGVAARHRNQALVAGAPNRSWTVVASTESVVSIALVTLSNGADNISVYVPFFVIGRANLWLILIAYAALVALWCFVGRWLGSHSLILRSVDRWGHWAVPLVFVGLGIYILSS